MLKRSIVIGILLLFHGTLSFADPGLSGTWQGKGTAENAEGDFNPSCDFNVTVAVSPTEVAIPVADFHCGTDFQFAGVTLKIDGRKLLYNEKILGSIRCNKIHLVSFQHDDKFIHTLVWDFEVRDELLFLNLTMVGSNPKDGDGWLTFSATLPRKATVSSIE